MRTTFLLAPATTMVVLSSVICERRPCRFWVQPSLIARRRYSATDFMRDLILDDIEELNIEYRSGLGFRNFFRMKSSTFETLLNMTAKKFTKADTNMRNQFQLTDGWRLLWFLANRDSYHSLHKILSKFQNK